MLPPNKIALYHYTDRLTAADIIQCGLIRARSLTLHRDLLGQDEGRVTAPLVWLSSNPVIESTVAAKLWAAGWPRSLIGDLYRFAVADDYAPLGLGEFADQSGIEHEWWEWIVRTGALVGSHYTTWRCYPGNIAAADWQRVEKLSGYRGNHPNWAEIER